MWIKWSFTGIQMPCLGVSPGVVVAAVTFLDLVYPGTIPALIPPASWDWWCRGSRYPRRKPRRGGWQPLVSVSPTQQLRPQSSLGDVAMWQCGWGPTVQNMGMSQMHKIYHIIQNSCKYICVCVNIYISYKIVTYIYTY